MSTCRLRLIFLATTYLIAGTAFSMGILREVYWSNPQLYSPMPYLTMHTLHLLAIFGLRWLYETPLETVQEAARQRMKRRPKPFRIIGDYTSPGDYRFYTKAGTIICVALGHWVFWVWLIMPEYECVSVPLGLAGAICVWRRRMDLLGPGYQFACDVEAENARSLMSAKIIGVPSIC